jgi:hypothetical protein
MSNEVENIPDTPNELEQVDWNQVVWETVVQEAGAQIVFDTVGDQFIGLYTGKRDVELVNNKGEMEKFTVLTFKGTDGNPYQTNAGWKLETGFMSADIKRGDIVRVTYVKDVDTGQPSPMKDFRVECARPRETDTA